MDRSSSKIKNLLSVYFIAFIDNFGFAITFTLFAILLLNPDMGMLSSQTSIATRNLLLGILAIGYPLMQFFGAPIIGEISDRYGRKKAFVIALLGITLGFVLSSLSIAFRSYTCLLISRAFSGFFAASLAVCLAAIADIQTNKTKRAHSYGTITVIQGVSWILAMLVGSYLSNPKYVNPSTPFWITAALSLVSLVFVAGFYKEKASENKRIKIDILKGIKDVYAAVKEKNLRHVIYAFFLWILGWSVAIRFFPAVAKETYHANVFGFTFFLLVVGITWPLGGSVLNRLLHKIYSTKQILTIGVSFLTIFTFFTLLSRSFLVFGLMFSISAIFSALTMSNLYHLFSLNSAKKNHGKVMGFSQSLSALGLMSGPLIGGLLALISIDSIFYIAGFAFLLALFFVQYQKDPKDSKKTKKTSIREKVTSKLKKRNSSTKEESKTVSKGSSKTTSNNASKTKTNSKTKTPAKRSAKSSKPASFNKKKTTPKKN